MWGEEKEVEKWRENSRKREFVCKKQGERRRQGECKRESDCKGMRSEGEIATKGMKVQNRL